jgi:tetraacyldisaccharide 4'-kinase
MMREPSFWWEDASVAARLLAPAAALYGAVAQARLHGRGRRAAAPVICIGNLTVGGGGKTPLALTTARMLRSAGELPVFLTRGYGGSLAGPIEVDPLRHTAREVGDEPLLLANTAPTILARARVAGAAMVSLTHVIVMDDGFQNPALRKDLVLLVIDARRGIGNGRVIPAGPLRAPLGGQLDRADALIVVGESSRADQVATEARKRSLPLLRAQLRPEGEFMAALATGRVLAFAGIADPEKFFTTLTMGGICLAATRSFPDHHRYTRAEARALCDEADREGLVLVTTEKDLVRLRGEEELAELAAHAYALPITLVLEDEERFNSLLLERLADARSERSSVSSPP